VGVRKGKKHRKHGRNKRNGRNVRQRARTYQNKLDRVNRDRLKSGKSKLTILSGYNPITGERTGGLLMI